ncbi:hypothetical protein JK2ML_0525 [Mycobacterium leprae Kyoto-2]|uniref:Uncharacterized protein n=3 Tax=Mycobacterium leprae TaxID=1769 RepID=Q9CCR7_MYCLE|nr:hypothetical protein DIJ64_02835 [Mycobacterium leprae]OAR20215.1 hypothetical protein A8144_02900 [Mycobacterium leprae 3125609]OAX71663.1 hypothetical protein A3216_04500 [Mycobacterium leprae 7935681]CAR70618.1 conserved hypothetical protein [Mycobacterium leprae Br4923]BBC16613.1 hypothetical protein JK2ML_0525 [Mycobacterium leprae Kyoto-2]
MIWSPVSKRCSGRVRNIAQPGGHSVGVMISGLARSPLRPGGVVEVDGLPVLDVPQPAP